MTDVRLENEKLIIEIKETGAELVRIYDKVQQREVLWEAKPEIWGRHAPILFPFIGNSYEGRYCHQGKTYPMTAHGFARDRNFNLQSLSDAAAVFCQTDDEDTYAVYPFHYSLAVGHRLEGNKLYIDWNVTNRGDDKMWYVIGGHPAFRVPDGNQLYDFTFRFEGKESLHYEAPNEQGYADVDRQGILPLVDGKAPLTEGFFDQVLTYIFDEAQVERVALLLPGDVPYVTLHCKDFPYLGVWTMERTHPFVCLEPWYGRCVDDGYTGELKDRADVLSLEPGETFQTSYMIEIH